MNPNETVIVIRSLVPGGVAQQDGHLIPGDRLVFVNDTNLENASLDHAVQALKGAPKGIVRIGVAKPLPIPDSVSHSQVSDENRSPTIAHEYYKDHQPDKDGAEVSYGGNGEEGGSPTQNMLMKSESF